MKLILRRNQKSGLIGKTITFALDAKVQLSETEQSSVKAYKMGKEILYSKDRMGVNPNDNDSFGGLARNLMAVAAIQTITVNDLVNGKTIECKDILEMNGMIEQLKEATSMFNSMLKSAAHFEGEEVLEY